eukprot:9041982-Alexandrium_andersonii.AAC.1
MLDLLRALHQRLRPAAYQLRRKCELRALLRRRPDLNGSGSIQRGANLGLLKNRGEAEAGLLCR